MDTVFLVFGLTGDLMKKKGIPALFALWQKNALPKNFKVAGLSRKVWSKEAIAAHIGEAIGGGVPEAFTDLFSIYTGAGEDAASVAALKKEYLLDVASLFIYLCVSPELYAHIITNLRAAGLLPGPNLLIEKPFGSDGASAKALEELLLASGVQEKQVFRIDHFLAKEAMQDLHELRGADITSIEVYLNESFGVEKRGAMYDPVGALRDVGQNHLLEAAAAVLGDRTLALQSLHVLSSEEIKTHTVRGQYEGYAAIEGVAPNSQTETYFKIESYIEWKGKKISLLLESGKRLPWRREVAVTLASGERKIIPFESGANEYETLFAEAFAGEHGRFVSMPEVEALWRFIDPIEKGWRENLTPLLPYIPDSAAPTA